MTTTAVLAGLPPALELADELAGILTPHWPELASEVLAGGAPYCMEGAAGGSGAGDGGEPAAGGTGDGGTGDGGEPAAGSTGDGGTGDGGEWTPPTREEYEATIRERDAAREAAAKADKNRRERERKAAREAGNYEALYNDANKDLERVTGLVASSAVRDVVAETAQRLRFRNPALAHRLIDTKDVTADVNLDGDTIEASVDQSARTLIEKRLEAALKADPYLGGDAPPRQLANAGHNANNSDGAGSAAMNAEIRRAAGRGA